MTRTKYVLHKETRLFTSPRMYGHEIIRALSDCNTVLDIGCGRYSPLRFIDGERLVGVDAYEPDLKRAQIAKTHDEFVLSDVKDLHHHFGQNEFDACVALDVIEHFTKQEGLEFLQCLEGMARHKVVISTPNGYLPQECAETGDFQAHLSGWTPRDMESLGYRVIGVHGAGCLRMDHHRLRFRPAPLWALISC